jgi:hypothetical protein
VPPELGDRRAGDGTSRTFLDDTQSKRSRKRDENQSFVAAVGPERKT